MYIRHCNSNVWPSVTRVAGCCVSLSFNDFFFFSSRRRHTRLQGDWSSDVCSSDLVGAELAQRGHHLPHYERQRHEDRGQHHAGHREDHADAVFGQPVAEPAGAAVDQRSEEHTSELQSPCNLVCRLLLEKKKIDLPKPVNQKDVTKIDTNSMASIVLKSLYYTTIESPIYVTYLSFRSSTAY